MFHDLIVVWVFGLVICTVLTLLISYGSAKKFVNQQCRVDYVALGDGTYISEFDDVLTLDSTSFKIKSCCGRRYVGDISGGVLNFRGGRNRDGNNCLPRMYDVSLKLVPTDGGYALEPYSMTRTTQGLGEVIVVWFVIMMLPTLLILERYLPLS